MNVADSELAGPRSRAFLLWPRPLMLAEAVQKSVPPFSSPGRPTNPPHSPARFVVTARALIQGHSFYQSWQMAEIVSAKPFREFPAHCLLFARSQLSHPAAP